MTANHDWEHGLEGATLSAILAEAIKAEAKHGLEKTLRNPHMPVVEKLAALMEEVGEVAELLTYDKGYRSYLAEGTVDNPTGEQLLDAEEQWRLDLVKELIQVANVAAAWAESVDHGGN